MIEICLKNKCTGCSACFNICPKGAIKMQEEGAGGYILPVIDQDICIDCGLCEKTCPVNNPIEAYHPVESFALTLKDDLDLARSASGGAATSLSRHVLENNGIVYGCELSSYCDIKHIRIDSVKDIYRLQGSKYVQSEIGNTYQFIKSDLKQGRQVLFIGTPCQVAGLRAYLKIPHSNLICVDLVCHGVPSQKLLSDHILSKYKSKSNNLKVYFRKKRGNREQATGNDIVKFGLFPQGLSYKKNQDFPYDDYITAFMSGIIFRESCFTCQYSCENRVGDITLADYWGLGNDTTIKTGAGVSLVLINTEKGKKIFSKLTGIYFEKRTVKEAIDGNGQLQTPFNRPGNRDAFLSDYAEIGIKAYKKHLRDYKKSWLRKYRLEYIRKHRILWFFYRIYFATNYRINRLKHK